MRLGFCLFLTVALFQSSCTWTSTCTRDDSGAEHCEDSVVAAHHATASGSAELSCGEEGGVPTTWAPEFAGIAECTIEQGTLKLHVGSGACHNIDLSVPEFAGAGTYQIPADAKDGLSIAMYAETGCQSGASTSTGLSPSCDAESSHCQVTIGGDFSLERGGDVSVSIDCALLLYSGSGVACGVCAPARPIELSFRDCAWGS